MHLTREEIEEIEQQVDKAFLKCTGRTWREGESSPPDTLASIAADYPRLFVKGESQ
jgi:hypothetical protein